MAAFSMTVLPILEAFAISRGEVVALAGGGGKTSLMWALARAANSAGWRVITTTTTRIWPPRGHESPVTVLLDGRDDALGVLGERLARSAHVTAAGHRRDDGKLGGIATQLVDGIAAARLADLVLVEADGAAGRALKAPRQGEPVYPASTTLAVVVAGIEALGAPLDEAHVFRAALAARITGLEPGAALTPEAAAELLVGPRGLAAPAPPGARIAALVNKVEGARRDHAAYALARRLLERGAPRLTRVLIGAALRPEAGFDVLER